VSTPAPRTRLNICTAATATTACAGTAAGANVGSGIQLYGSKNRWLALSNTGGMVTQTPQILAPRNYTNGTAKRYLNFTFVNGSGATTNGLAAATARVEIRPCNLSGVGC
jgi:type 1 fimbria pilin